jgi:hypothetical protein
MPNKFINNAGNNIPQAFLDSATPIPVPLPKTGALKGVPVEKAG